MFKHITETLYFENKPVGVMAAMETSNVNYSVNYSLCNPGCVKNGMVINRDRFERRHGAFVALGKIVEGLSLKMPVYNTKRALAIKEQINAFKVRAKLYFKDKSLVEEL